MGKHWNPNTNEVQLTDDTPKTAREFRDTHPEVVPGTTVNEPVPAKGPEPVFVRAEPTVQENKVAALQDLKAALTMLQSHSAAKVPGGLIYEAILPLERAYATFKEMVG